MATLTDFIHTHDEALVPGTCQFLIDLFEQNPEYQNQVNVGESPHFTEFNLTEVSELSPEIKKIHTDLIRDVYMYRDEYYEVFNRNIFPESHAFEKFKIRKYEYVDSYTNVDVINHDTSRRYLAFFWFLNDTDGGQIEFLDLLVTPKVGTLLMFPPMWMFPYKEHAPSNIPKYILTTYLHYK